VLNDAGYDIAPLKQLSSEKLKAVIDTNFYGVVNVMFYESGSCAPKVVPS
jgi:hypothetical protein